MGDRLTGNQGTDRLKVGVGAKTTRPVGALYTPSRTPGAAGDLLGQQHGDSDGA